MTKKTGSRCIGSKKRSAILQPDRGKLPLYLFPGDFENGLTSSDGEDQNHHWNFTNRG